MPEGGGEGMPEGDGIPDGEGIPLGGLCGPDWLLLAQPDTTSAIAKATAAANATAVAPVTPRFGVFIPLSCIRSALPA
jgi:hypothetical protein